MTLPADLDGWVSTVGADASLHATRDPDLIYPPCVFVGIPDIVASTLTTCSLQVPVYLVASDVGAVAGDQLLGNITAVLTATGAKTATVTTLTVAGVDYYAYLISAQLTATLTI